MPLNIFSDCKKRTVCNSCMLAIKSICGFFYLFYAFSGHHPPVFAQTAQNPRYQLVPVITTTDALQNDHIIQNKQDLDDVKITVQKLNDQVIANAATAQAAAQKNSEAISGMQGEERGIAAFLGILSTVQIILQVKKKKEE